ncbi:MAG: hypothetical protein N4A74_01005 [Carboxylicivirga sp.]|jgi:hypothetical protein|nr:hypothetical protein [Carboxylicivirga sp.]
MEQKGRITIINNPDTYDELAISELNYLKGGYSTLKKGICRGCLIRIGCNRRRKICPAYPSAVQSQEDSVLEF